MKIIMKLNASIRSRPNASSYGSIRSSTYCPWMAMDTFSAVRYMFYRSRSSHFIRSHK